MAAGRILLRGPRVQTFSCDCIAWLDHCLFRSFQFFFLSIVSILTIAQLAFHCVRFFISQVGWLYILCQVQTTLITHISAPGAKLSHTRSESFLHIHFLHITWFQTRYIAKAVGCDSTSLEQDRAAVVHSPHTMTGSNRSSKGFQQLPDETTNKRPNPNDATIDIPLEKVPTRTGVRRSDTFNSTQGRHLTYPEQQLNEKSDPRKRPVAGRRITAEKKSRKKGSDGEEDTITNMGLIYNKVK